MQFYLGTGLQSSGGTITHHQERKQLHLQHLLFVTQLLQSWKSWNWFECAVCGVDAVDTVICAPDDG
jgi:hypothetical protein